MKTVYIAQRPSSLFFRNQETFDEVLFLFCDFSMCDINHLRAKSLRFIGCYFEDGYMENNEINNIDFSYCFQAPNTKIDLVLSKVGEVSLVDSHLNIEIRSEELISTTSKEPKLASQIYEAIFPFMDAGDHPKIYDAHFSKIKTLLTSYKGDRMLVFILSLTFMTFDEEAREHFVQYLFPHIHNLNSPEQQYFKQYFTFLLEDEYTFGKQLRSIEAFLKEK